MYEYVLDDSYASLGDTAASSLDAMDSTYQSTANLLGSMCKTSSGKASLRASCTRKAASRCMTKPGPKSSNPSERAFWSIEAGLLAPWTDASAEGTAKE